MKNSEYYEPFMFAARTYSEFKKGDRISLNGTYFCNKYDLDESKFLKHEKQQLKDDLIEEQRLTIESLEKRLNRSLNNFEKLKVMLEVGIKFKPEKYGILFWLDVCQYYISLDSRLKKEFIKIAK